MSNLEAKDRSTEKQEVEDWKDDFRDQIEEQEKLEEDKDELVKRAEKLNLEGTTEGARDIKSDIEDAGKEINGAMEDEAFHLNEVMAEDEKGEEEDIQTRSDATEEDIIQAENIAEETNRDDAREQITEAVKNAEEDKKFLDDIKKKRENIRENAEDVTQEQLKNVKNNEVNFD